jgi:BCCT, betaine/carnitine/choline family transporter
MASVFGVFVGSLSKGRKLYELALYCFLAPVCACILWACIWGGVALRQSRQALELEKMGEMYYNNSAHYLADGSDLCYDVPQADVMVDGAAVFTNRLLGITPVCKFDETRPSEAAINVLNSFRFPETFSGNGMGQFLTVIYLSGCVLFYVTMSDSASFMVDKLASNGRKNNHWSRRLFWACAAGALATTLLSMGGSSALAATESSIVVGVLPFVVLMCYLVQTITLFCQEANTASTDGDNVDYSFPNQPEFDMPVYGGVFNVVEYVASFGKVNPARVELGMHLPTKLQAIEFIKGLFVPFVSLHQIFASAYPENPKTNNVVVAGYAILYVAWIAVLLASRVYPGLSGVATTLCFLKGGYLGLIRMGFRSRYNLRSNYFADFMTSTFMWPQVLTQMRVHCVARAQLPRRDACEWSNGSRGEGGSGEMSDVEKDTVDECI